MDSPRGRIYLMKEVLEGALPMEDALPYVDRCLGCVACQPACPSGVPYGELLTPFRAMAEEKRKRSFGERLSRAMALRTLPYASRLRWALRLSKLARPFRRLLPRSVRAMLEIAPARLPRGAEIPELVPAEGEKRARVALLLGCAQRVLEPEINVATARVLARNGVEVLVPASQGCCGALSLHDGADAQAQALARALMDSMPQDVDAVVTNAAGCGSGIHEYPLLFAGTDEEARAKELASRVVDVTVFLDEIGMRAPVGFGRPVRVAYHDACHLGHAQGVREAPRRLLRAIPGVEVVTPAESEICCGSAGTYNIEQPDIAAQLGAQKARHILATNPDVVVTGNIGCMTQIRLYLEGKVPIRHTIEWLDEAYRAVGSGVGESESAES